MPTAGRATSISVDARIKEKLAALKGDRSWDEFMTRVLEIYPADDAMREMAQRKMLLAELRAVQAAGKRGLK